VTKNKFPENYSFLKIYEREEKRKEREDKYPTAPRMNSKRKKMQDLGG
jgi:hypothetical protein